MGYENVQLKSGGKRWDKRDNNNPATEHRMGKLRQLKTSHRVMLAVGLVGAVIAWLAWLCDRDPRISFLPGDARAEWIVFPSAPDAMPHPVAELGAEFRREFTLTEQPRTARVSVRAPRATGDEAAGRRAEQLLEHFQAGRPFREDVASPRP
jgi:hypothetical protein